MSNRKDWEDEYMLREWLEAAGHRPRGSTVHCPWHDDTSPSASIICDKDGHWRVYCHAKCGRGGDIYDLRGDKPTTDKGNGLKVATTHSKPAQQSKPARFFAAKEAMKAEYERQGQVQWYRYGDDIANPVLIIAKLVRPGQAKTFRSFTPKDGGYLEGMDGKRGHPVYHSYKLAAHPTILVCEGEKAVDAAWSCGIPATTSNGGALAAKKTDWSALRGKAVVLWPDNDDAGAKYMDEVAEILAELECTVTRIDVSSLELPKGGDVADMVATWGDKTMEQRGNIVTSLMEEASPVGVLAAWRAERREMQEGKLCSLPVPLTKLGIVSRAFLPGTITIICADPGAGKSFLSVQLMAYWEERGIVAHARLFEDTDTYHMGRLLAQFTGIAGHADSDWVAKNPEADRIASDTHEARLVRIGNRIVAENKEVKGKPWTAEMICEWAEAKAASGSRVILIDPLTCIAEGEKSWQQDFDVVMALKSIARRHKCSVLLTTHPKTGAKAPAMSAMSGGTAWPRFAHTVLWLESHEAGHSVTTDEGPTMANRTIRILKCRNGKGTGLKLAAEMGGDLKFYELGLIIPDAQKCAIAKESKAMEMSRRAQKVSATPQQNEDLFG